MNKQNLAIPPFEKDEWEGWREHPITQWLFDHFLANAAIEAKQTFIDFAWEAGKNDPVYYASLYERSKVLKEIQELNYEDFPTEAN